MAQEAMSTRNNGAKNEKQVHTSCDVPASIFIILEVCMPIMVLPIQRYILKPAIAICFVLATFATSTLSYAATIFANTSDELTIALNTSQVGDTVRLNPGIYIGHFVIPTAITLDGNSQATIDASGSGTAITVAADNVRVNGLSVINWGDDLTDTNAGIKALSVGNIFIENNRLSGPAFGVYLQNVVNARVTGNDITGDNSMRSADRGNGIHLIEVTESWVNDNRIRQTRDGLYIINSQDNRLENNHMSDLRFGIHYMYSHKNTVSQNTAQQVRVGYALMSSDDLVIEGNTAEDCDDYGLLLNFVNRSQITGNHITGVNADLTQAVSGDEGKAIFIYNSNNNQISQNTFANSDMGINLTAGSENNEIYANNFVHNTLQVKYVSTRAQEWSKDQVGNYWSNYIGWDIDNNGIGDTAFEPNDGVDKMLWKYPEAKVLMDSPAVLLLRWVQRSFPVLKSPGVKDSYPMLKFLGASS